MLVARQIATIALLAGCLTGCSAHHIRGPQSALTDERTVRHIVLIWMKDPSDAVARQRLIEASQTFREIPGVLSVSIGRAIPSTRPAVDSTFDLAVEITFRDAAAMDAYEIHPIHQSAVREVLVPNVSRIQIYDFTAQ